MKIVYFIDHLRPDGTQRFLTQLVKGLGERGHRQAVVCLNDSWDQEVAGQITAAGCEVRIVGKIPLASGVGLVSTRRWLRREHFDVAITMLFAADVTGRLLARTSGVTRIVTSLRARNVNYKGWQRRLARATMPLADAVVLNSQGLREFAVREEGAHQDRLVVIPNGVQASDYSQPHTKGYLRREFNIPEAGEVIGSAGRMTYQKGMDILLEAVASIPNGSEHLLLVGEGEELPALRRQASSRVLAGRVHFPGYRRDLPSLMGALDVYVQPSRFEGMPNSLLEAMAAGCPVIATAVDGNSDLLEDGQSGWLTPPEDSQALAERIGEVLSNPQEAKSRGNAARERIVASFNLDLMVGRWEKVLYENKN